MSQSEEKSDAQPSNEGRTVIKDIVERIESLDLDCIKVSLMKPDRGKEGWSRRKVDAVAASYKKFLYMSVTEDGPPVIPSSDVDEFWHAHILDTHKYAADCDRIAGHFIHHFPYLGMRSDEDRTFLHSSFENTRQKQEQLFGVDSAQSLLLSPADCSNSSCGAGSCGPRSYLEHLAVGPEWNESIDASGRPTLLGCEG